MVLTLYFYQICLKIILKIDTIDLSETDSDFTIIFITGKKKYK